MRLTPGATIVVATHNPGKLHEIRALLLPFGLKVEGASELNLTEPEETGSTFAENAAIKARAAALAAGQPALADDSGLAVDALDGDPGIYSARWAGPKKDFLAAMTRVEQELRKRGAGDRSAKFVCALALAQPDGAVAVFEGEVHGHLEFPPRGNKGFGYDPIFVPDGLRETFGEIETARKHAISHRARAFQKFAAAMKLPIANER